MKKNPRRTGNKQGKSKLNTEGNLRGFGRPGAGLKRGLAIFFAVTLALNPAFAHGSEAGGIDLTAEADMPSVSMGDAGGYARDLDPAGTPVLEVEAENCTFSGGLVSGSGDGNFTQVSGGFALRNQGSTGTISGRVVLGEAGSYYVRVYVGSREGNSGTDSISIDGGSSYHLMVPEWTAPGWYGAELRDPATGNPAGPLSLEAGEHTFEITSNAAWCYYDRIEFSKASADAAVPELTISAVRGLAANNNFALGGAGLFADTISDRAVLRLIGDNTFTYTLHVPEAGNYKITSRASGKNGDSGTAVLRLNGTDYDVNVEASGLDAGMPLTEAVAAESVAL